MTSNQPAITDDRDFERFSLVVNGPALFQSLISGIELGVFTELADKPNQSLDALAGQLGIAPTKLRVLLFALCNTGVLTRSESGTYMLTALGTDFLGGSGPDNWTPILLGWHHIYYPAMVELTTALTTGTNTALTGYPGTEPTLYRRLQHSPEVEAQLHLAMSAFTERSLPGLLEFSGLDNSSVLLDVGGGDGTTALALAEHYQKLTITILDVPSVAARAEQHSLHERISVVACDAQRDEYPADVDAILFSHFLEVFSAEEIREILGRAFRSLRPGGQVLVYGFNATPDETEGVFSARLALYLTALATGNGMTYPASDYEKWLIEAGFEKAHTVSGLPYEHGLTLATKPE